MNTKEIESKVKALRELQALIEDAQQEAESIKDDLKTLMGDATELRVGEYKITYKAVSSCRIDTATLKTALPEIAERFTKTVTARRFCVA